MSAEDDARAMAMEMAQALTLVRAGHTLYTDLPAAVRETMGPYVNADIPVLVQRLNEAITAYAPRDTAARNLLAKYN
tara:strand:- start:278 stop:508 length:231 start_codon:yes stop_codon:yes gene_type:complete